MFQGRLASVDNNISQWYASIKSPYDYLNDLAIVFTTVVNSLAELTQSINIQKKSKSG